VRWLPIVVALGCAGHAGQLDLVDVQRADLVVSVEVTGELVAVDSTDVAPPAVPEASSFKVAWLAPEGSEVKAGDPLVTLSADDLDRGLESARSDREEAQKRLDKRTEEVTLARRDSELRVLEAEAGVQKAALKLQAPAELVASLDLRTQQLDAEIARMTLEQTRSAVDLARRSDQADLQDLIDERARTQRRIDGIQRAVSRMSIAAPRAGTVVYPTIGMTDKRKLGDSVYRSDTVVQVVGLDTMIGNGQVDEIDVGRLATGQRVALRLDALPDLGLTGALASITGTVQADSDSDPSKVVRVTIAVDPRRGTGLRPGMRFRGRIETLRVPDVVQVPANAVFVGPDGPFAYREAPDGVARVPLALGRRASDAIEVLAGLSAGDRVSKVDPEQEAP
jgi:hypothetical protein